MEIIIQNNFHETGSPSVKQLRLLYNCIITSDNPVVKCLMTGSSWIMDRFVLGTHLGTSSNPEQVFKVLMVGTKPLHPLLCH